MKIGIDGSPLAIPFPCGVKNYAQNLLWTLAKIDHKNKYYIFSKEKITIPGAKNFKLIRISPKIPILKKQFFLTYTAKKMKVDVFHLLESFGPFFLNGLNLVTTVHDVNLDKIYGNEKFFEFLNHKGKMKVIASRIFSKTNTFIAVSNFVKKELSCIIQKKQNIVVIPEAANSTFTSKNIVIRNSRKFFLCFGDFSDKKNVPNVLNAYSRLPENIKNICELKVVMSTNHQEINFLKVINSLNISANVKMIRKPSDNELFHLYRNAVCLVFPSLYEGFGLPILEAMASGCPVITSNIGATKQTAGKAALLVNPHSVNDIKNKMIEISTNNKAWKKYLDLGIKRSNLFSWEKTAKKTLGVYQNTLKK